MAMIDSGINVKPGSGVAAASEYWRKALEMTQKFKVLVTRKWPKIVEENLIQFRSNSE